MWITLTMLSCCGVANAKRVLRTRCINKSNKPHASHLTNQPTSRLFFVDMCVYAPKSYVTSFFGFLTLFRIEWHASFDTLNATSFTAILNCTCLVFVVISLKKKRFPREKTASMLKFTTPNFIGDQILITSMSHCKWHAYAWSHPQFVVQFVVEEYKSC